MENDIPPAFDMSSLTTDQHGMLEILGNPRVIEYRLLEFEMDARRIEGLPS
jgi:hypothetical protein